MIITEEKFPNTHMVPQISEDILQCFVFLSIAGERPYFSLKIYIFKCCYFPFLFGFRHSGNVYHIYEIEQIIKYDAETVVLGGKAQIKNAMAEILKRRDSKKIILLDEKTGELSTTLGAMRILKKGI